MRVKVIKTFRDKHTKKVHQAGKVLNLKSERIEEINKNLPGFVEEYTKSKE